MLEDQRTAFPMLSIVRQDLSIIPEKRTSSRDTLWLPWSSWGRKQSLKNAVRSDGASVSSIVEQRRTLIRLQEAHGSIRYRVRTAAGMNTSVDVASRQSERRRVESSPRGTPVDGSSDLDDALTVGST